jgi:hypothetical protein
MKRISGKTSLVLSLAIILFLSFGFTSLYSYITTKDALRQTALIEFLPLISDNAFSEIHSGRFVNVAIPSSPTKNESDFPSCP